MRQHASACVSIRQHTSHTSAYVSRRQHTSACVSIRPHTSHTSAYVSIRHLRRARVGDAQEHMSAYVRIRRIHQHTSAYVTCGERESEMPKSCTMLGWCSCERMVLKVSVVS
jgi:hypothetical protein